MDLKSASPLYQKYQYNSPSLKKEGMLAVPKSGHLSWVSQNLVCPTRLWSTSTHGFQTWNDQRTQKRKSGILNNLTSPPPPPSFPQVRKLLRKFIHVSHSVISEEKVVKMIAIVNLAQVTLYTDKRKAHCPDHLVQ